MSTQGSTKIAESNRGPDQGEAYGIAGLSQQLEGIHFPISKQDILEQYGDKTFEWTKGGDTLKLKDCLDALPDEINSITQITEAVSDSSKNNK